MKSLYALKDTLTTFQNPFISANDNSARRDLSLALNATSKEEFNLKYKDYQLFYLGDYDDDTGHIINNVRFVCNCMDLINYAVIKDNEVQNGNKEEN